MLCLAIYSVGTYSLLKKHPLWCIRGKVWQVVWMVDELAGSPKFWVHIPQFTVWFKDNVLNIAGSDFSCSLVFDVQVASFALNPDDSVSCFPFEDSFSWGFVFKINSISYFESWFCSLSNLWLSKYFLAMDSDSQCWSRHNNPESGSPRNLVSGWSS